MPERKINLYYEGDFERAVLQGLLEAGLLPKGLSPVPKAPASGQNAVLEQVGKAILETGLHAVLCVDLDDRNPDTLAEWALRGLKKTVAPQLAPRLRPRDSVRPEVSVIDAASGGAVALVPVGRGAQSPWPEQWPFATRAMDDLVLSLFQDPTLHLSLMASEKKEILPHSATWEVMADLMSSLDERSHPVRTAKRASLLARGVSNFAASPAKFAEIMLKLALQTHGPAWLEARFAPLLIDLRAAETLIRAEIPATTTGIAAQR